MSDFTANAVIRKNRQSSFTADAVIVLTDQRLEIPLPPGLRQIWRPVAILPPHGDDFFFRPYR